jgi:glycosyltransferase involved in cell wall biosynthesis
MYISIVLICHHDRGFLEEALRSAMSQHYYNYDIVLQMDNLSMAANTNEAVRKAKGDYVKWLHDDDILLPNCLADMSEGEGADVIFANAINFSSEYPDHDDYLIKSRIPLSLQDMIDDYCIHAGTLMYRRQVLLDNPLDEKLWTGEEYELNMRLFSKGYKFKHINKTVSRYRVHKDMKSLTAYAHVSEDIKGRRLTELERIRDMYRKK